MLVPFRHPPVVESSSQELVDVQLVVPRLLCVETADHVDQDLHRLDISLEHFPDPVDLQYLMFHLLRPSLQDFSKSLVGFEECCDVVAGLDPYPLSVLVGKHLEVETEYIVLYIALANFKLFSFSIHDNTVLDKREEALGSERVYVVPGCQVQFLLHNALLVSFPLYNGDSLLPFTHELNQQHIVIFLLHSGAATAEH